MRTCAKKQKTQKKTANSQQSHSVKPSLRNAPRQKDGTTPPSVPQTSSPSYVVRVSGLPKQTTADDLLPLFDGLEMSGAGIHVMTAAAGSVECTGDAFVEMGSETWAKKAVARSGATLSVCGGVATARQVVEIHRSSIAQLRAAKRGAGRKNGGGGGNGPEVWFYLRLLNVGSDVGTEQVRVQMERFSVRDEDVKFVKTNSGGTEGGPGMRVARVAFRTRENRDAALKVCEGGVVLGGGTVMAEDGGCDVRGVKNAGDDGCNCVVRMRGLPYTSTEGDIVEFFDGFDIAPGGIMRGKDRHGRASGEAWVTFVRPCDASRAVVKLDKAHMGSRYIELKF